MLLRILLIFFISVFGQAQGDIAHVLGSGNPRLCIWYESEGDFLPNSDGNWLYIYEVPVGFDSFFDSPTCQFNPTRDRVIWKQRFPEYQGFNNTDRGPFYAGRPIIKFDETSGFLPTFDGGQGGILVFESGSIKIQRKGQRAARAKYGLLDGEVFLGVVGHRVCFTRETEKDNALGHLGIYWFDFGDPTRQRHFIPFPAKGFLYKRKVGQVESARQGPDPDTIRLWTIVRYMNVAFEDIDLDVRTSVIMEMKTTVVR